MSKATGLDSFFDVLAIVKDPKKFEAKALELKKMIDEYKTVIEAVVELSKVNEYTQSIRMREETSKKALQDAEDQARKIMEDTGKIAGEMKAKATETLNAASEELNKNKQLQTELKEKLAEVEAQKKVLAVHAEELERKSQALDAIEKELLEKRNKLINALS